MNLKAKSKATKNVQRRSLQKDWEKKKRRTLFDIVTKLRDKRKFKLINKNIKIRD